MMRNLNKWLIVAIIAIIASGMVLTLMVGSAGRKSPAGGSPFKNPSFTSEHRYRARESADRY